MNEEYLAIKTTAGYQRVMVYPTSIQTRGHVTTAEAISDWGAPGFDALMNASESRREADIRINGREVCCWVELAGIPSMSPKKVMWHRLVLTEKASVTA